MPLPSLPGLEARFRWDDDAVILNDKLSGFPVYDFSTIGGWRSTADAELPSDVSIGRERELPRYALRRGKTITLEGSTKANSLEQLRQAEDALVAAFWDVQTEKKMTLDVRVAGVWTPVYFFNARSVSADIPENQPVKFNRSTNGYERAFVITLRMSVPVFYSVTPATTSTGSVSNVSLGIIPPVTPPIMLPAGLEGANATIVNEGSAPADALVRIYGPVSDPVITSQTLGKYISLLGVSISADQWIDIDFESRQVLLELVSDFRRFQDGNWWDRGVPGFPPGTSVIKLSGTTIEDPARAVVTFNPPRY